jgi:uncharacterized Tic20 family protein
MGCHLAGLGLFIIPPLTGVIACLIVWLISRKRHPMIDTHGKEALNFQLCVLIYLTISTLLWPFCIGVPLSAAVAIGALVLTLIAGVKASQGDPYRYPFCFRFLK